MAGPVVPNRTYPLHNATLEPPLPTFRAECIDAYQDEVRVYIRFWTEAGRIITIQEMAHAGGGEYTYTPEEPTTSQVMTIVCDPTPVTGAWAIGLFATRTTELPYDASTSAIQAAVDSLPDLNRGDVVVSGRLVEPGGVTLSLRSNRGGIHYLQSYDHGWFAHRLGLRDGNGNLITPNLDITTPGVGTLPGLGTHGYGEWWWDVISYRVEAATSQEGRLYSGDTSNPRQAASGGQWPFWYSVPPVLTVERPAQSENFDGTAPLFRWTVDTGSPRVPVTYQEIYYTETTNGDAVYAWATDSVRPTDNAPHITLPRDTGGDPTAREFRLPRSILVNSPTELDRYRASFRVVNGAGQQAVIHRDFDIWFQPPQTVTGFGGQLSADRSYMDLSWNRTPDPQFVRYRITAEGGQLPETELFATEDVDELEHRTFLFPYNTDVTFRAYAEASTNGEHQVSEPAVWTTHVSTPGTTVLSETVFPRHHALLPGRRTRNVIPQAKRDIGDRWNQEFPTIRGSRAFNRSVQTVYPLYEAADVAAQMATIATLETMYAGKETLLYRDGYGRVYAVQIVDMDETDPEDFRYQEVGLTLEQVAMPGGSL